MALKKFNEHNINSDDLEKVHELLSMLSKVDFDEENVNLYNWGYTKEELEGFVNIIERLK